MTSNHTLKAHGGEDRRKNSDRRSGYDRRAGVQPNGTEAENGNEIVFLENQESLLLRSQENIDLVVNNPNIAATNPVEGLILDGAFDRKRLPVTCPPGLMSCEKSGKPGCVECREFGKSEHRQ